MEGISTGKLATALRTRSDFRFRGEWNVVLEGRTESSRLAIAEREFMAHSLG
jgi:hypothetical protein